MKVPARYFDIKNYFKSLQVANELTNKHKIFIQKVEFENSKQFMIKTILGEDKKTSFL